MIEVKNLCKTFGRKLAVDQVSFKVNRGEVLAFIGPNGAGKSTTMRMITGFLPATSGVVEIDGISMAEQPLTAKSKIGYLPESAPLYEHKTVWEFLAFAAEIRGFSGKARDERINQAVKHCFLEPVLHQSIDTLSKGYKHRTCFAQAILHDPDILILDEPTDGLDPNQKREVRELIKRMGREKAIIISTHILEEVEAVADKVVLISGGQKVFEGTPELLKQQAAGAGWIKVAVKDQTPKELKKVLESLHAVQSVHCFEQFCLVQPQSSREGACQQILDEMTRRQWPLAQFGIEPGRLEDVFRKLTATAVEVTQ